MTHDIRIEHRYPEALPFLREHGPYALVVLHDLIAHSEQRGTDLVVQASVREIAARLSFLSKDTVHRRLRQLRHAHVINTATPSTATAFEKPTYTVDLTGTGISIVTDHHRRPERTSTSDLLMNVVEARTPNLTTSRDQHRASP